MSNPSNRRSLRLLSLDGGGVKGLASLLILKRIFRTLQKVDGLDEIPRPCEYFDLIGGTSTGGLVAIMLGRLRMTIDECIEVFQHISEAVFGDIPGTFSRLIGGLSGKPFFKADRLEKAVKELLISRGVDPDTLLKDSEHARCKVFVCATRAQTVHPVLLRSYTTWSEGEENYACHIWEAARATAAAPLFFEPIKLKISGATFVDGAMRLNNPISAVLNEADALFPDATFKSIISIGTGWTDVTGLAVEQVKAHNVIKTCIDISINANNEAQAFAKGRRGRDFLENKTYFRFDVERGLDTIALEEWKKLDDIDALTEAYLARPDKGRDLRDCAQSLSCKASSHITNLQEKGSNNGFPSTLPHYSNPNFSGREAELANIDKIFQNSPLLHQRAVLFGLGGIGKSQLAHEYGQRQSTQRSVFWVRANTAENIELGYAAIARRLLLDMQHATLADRLTAVKGHLEDVNTLPWLLVLDEADDKETFLGGPNGLKLAEYIPRASHGRVLITTRDSRLAGLCEGQVVPAQNGIRIGPMDFDNSFCLFQKCMRQDLMLDVPKDRCWGFLNMLGGLPLAIVQAASYMREEETSIEDFVALYKDIELHGELFQESAISTDMEQKSVLYTWELSYRRIAGPLYPESKSHAAMLLDLLAFLDAEESPFRYLDEIEYRTKDYAQPIMVPSMRRMIKPFTKPQKSPSSLLESIYSHRFTPNNTFRSAIGRLCNYSLVGSRECWIHPVVHSWIYRRLPLHERCKYINWMAGELMSHVPSEMPDGWAKYVMPSYSFTILVLEDLGILRHADIVLKYALSPLMNEYMETNHIVIPEIGDLLYRFGVISVSSGKVKEGVGYIQQSIVAAERSGQNEVSLNERKLYLAQARSHLNSAAQAVAEARLCHDETSSLEAEYWVAQCLRNDGQLQDGLAVLKNIINTYPISDPAQFEENKVRFMATIDAAAILVDLGDDESKTQARHFIDNWILPFLEKTTSGQFLNTITYPQVLVCRIEAAADQDDREAACEAVVDFDARHGSSFTGANPLDWVNHLGGLEQKEKRQEIVTWMKIFTRRRRPILHIMILLVNHPDESDYIDEDIFGWCDMYNSLGTAYFAQGKFKRAEAAHMNALGLHLWLHSEGSRSHLFRTNVRNLRRALFCQGDTKIRELETIQASFHNLLEETEYDQASSDHNRRGGKRDHDAFGE